MATSQLKKNCSWAYTPYGYFAPETLNLAIPFWDVQPIRSRERHDWWAADKNVRSIVSVGDGVEEVLATVRFESEPAEFMFMLQDALTHDTTLYYTQDGTTYPLRLVEIVSAGVDDTTVTGDRDRLGFGEWEARLRLRRTDGGSLSGIIAAT